MVEYRTIEKKDNPHISRIIKTVLTEFDADPKTTMLGDPTADKMYQEYLAPNSIYYVALLNGKIVGGCGIKQLNPHDSSLCELQRMYLLKEARGNKIGQTLMTMCLEKAKDFNFAKVYIETISNMHAAQSLYKKFGFHEIDEYLGNTGHTGCDVKMIKKLKL